jgi:hypothetical protein
MLALQFPREGTGCAMLFKGVADENGPRILAFAIPWL